MCGIVGFNWEDKGLLKKVTDSIAHRGPDGFGYYVDKNVSLGHRRLAIIDLSKNGKQPMCNEEGNVWVVFNGEIYNFNELKEDLELKNHKFKSNTDTEVIVHAYEEYGYDCVKRFNGMFAFGLYDTNKKVLFLARDHLGIKPLYYFWDGKKFIFSSEIKAILEFDIVKKLNLEAINKLILYKFVPDDKTVYQGIYKLKPGNYLVLKADQLNIQKYWDISNDCVLDYHLDQLKILLEDSVKKHLIADVEVGSFLSGGIDSSLITALAQKEISKSGKSIKTFNVSFNEFSESKYAKLTSQHIGSDHYELHVDEKLAIKSLDSIFKFYDEPVIDFGNIPTYLISKFANKKVKVVLAGEGADELFAGYDYYSRMIKIHKKVALLGPILKNLKFLNNEKIDKISQLYNDSGNAGDFYLNFSSNFNRNEVENYSTGVDFNAKPIKNFLNKLLYFDLKYLLPEYLLMKADKMTMANSLEERVPYLYPKIAEFAFNLPINLKINGKDEKFILKKVASSYLPKEIISRKKQGYGVPSYKWISNGQLGKLIINSIGDTKFVKQFIPAIQIEKILKNYKSSVHYNNQLWVIYSIENWANNLTFEAE